MVGVPRSRGCANCRIRKKGCDRKRPSCSNCLARGVECGGYEINVGRVFLNNPGNSDLVTYRRQTAIQQPFFQHLELNVPVSTRLASGAFVDNHIGSFLTEYIPVHLSRSSSGWLAETYTRHTSDKMLMTSLLCLGLYTTGRLACALKTYGQALALLQQRLNNRHGPDDDTVFAACKLLCLFEIYSDDGDINGSQSKRWGEHMEGHTAIMSLRSPREYRSGLSHLLFADSRYPTILWAIVTRKRYLLNTAEWRTQPWGADNPKTPFDSLLDILADLSGVLADADQIHARDDSCGKRGLMTTCLQIDDALQDWISRYGPLKTFSESDGILEEPIGTDDLDFALRTLVFWTASVILYSTMLSITPSPSESPTLASLKQHLHMAVKALPYFWTESAGDRGPNMAAFPLAVALQTMHWTPHLFEEEHAILVTALLKRNTVLSHAVSTLYPPWPNATTINRQVSILTAVYYRPHHQ